MKKSYQYLSLLPLIVAISACSSLSDWGFTDKSNLTPPAALVNFQPSLNVQPLWAQAATSGLRREANSLELTLNSNILYTADSAGNLVALQAQNGQSLWHQNIGYSVTSGPVSHNGLVAVTSANGQISVFNAQNGSPLWQSKLSGFAYAKPAINDQFVMAKSIDGHVYFFNSQNGALLWQYSHNEPSFVESGDSSPILVNNIAVLGFSDGRLVTLNPITQKLLWELPIAMPMSLQETAQMVGIVADPIVVNKTIYAVTYQGNLAAVDLMSGKTVWSRPLSSYQDFTSAGNMLYLSDANSHVYAINRLNGAVVWHQDQLDSRGLTAPVLMPAANAIVVGDMLGYLHFLSAQDGHFIARVQVARSAISAKPVINGNVVYVLTRTGTVTAYKIG